jgi:outer membrane protein TolC
MRRGLWIGTLIAGMAVASPARALDGAPADTLRLTLSECVAQALTQGEEIRLADAEFASVHAAYVQARSGALPRLSFSTTYTRAIKSAFQESAVPSIEPFVPDSLNPDLEKRVSDLERALPTAWLSGLGQLFSSTAFASKNTWIASLGLTQKVLQGGSIWNAVSGAGHALRAAESMHGDRKSEIVLQVRQAYLGALLAQRGARIAELALAQAGNQLERVRLRQDAGSASEFELLQIEVQRDNQIPMVKQAQLVRQVADLELRRLVNLPVHVPLALTTPLLDGAAMPARPAAVDTSGLVAAALRSPSLIAAEEMAEAYGHGVAVAAADRWPGLSLFANYSQQAYPKDAIPKRDDWVEDLNAGVRLDWTLFDGFLTKGAVETAKARRRVAECGLAQIREGVREAVVQSEYDLRRSAADLEARARTVELARRAFELANIRYEEGASDLLEVADARTAYQIARTNEAQARHDYFVALARLERYTGLPLFTAAAPQDPPVPAGRSTR